MLDMNKHILFAIFSGLAIISIVHINFQAWKVNREVNFREAYLFPYNLRI